MKQLLNGFAIAAMLAIATPALAQIPPTASAASLAIATPTPPIGVAVTTMNSRGQTYTTYYKPDGTLHATSTGCGSSTLAGGASTGCESDGRWWIDAKRGFCLRYTTWGNAEEICFAKAPGT